MTYSKISKSWLSNLPSNPTTSNLNPAMRIASVTPPVREEGQLHTTCDIRFRCLRQDGKVPRFELNTSRKAEIPTNRALPIYPAMSDSSTTMNELVADFLVSELQLNFVSWSEPIRTPRLRALPLPANPTADQISIIPVSSTPGIIEIVEAVAKGASERVIRVNSFNS